MQLVAAGEKLYVCYINTVQKEVVQGKAITVIFGVFYSPAYYAPCGEPCQLKPRMGQTEPTGDFETKGSSTVRLTGILLTPTGKPGEYRAELVLPRDVAVEKFVVFVLEGSLYDGNTNGPDQDTSHVETPDPVDDSKFAVTAATTTTTGATRPAAIPEGFSTFASILTLVIISSVLLILLLVAGHSLGRKQQKVSRFCHYCGRDLPSNVRYCDRCGTIVERSRK